MSRRITRTHGRIFAVLLATCVASDGFRSAGQTQQPGEVGAVGGSDRAPGALIVPEFDQPRPEAGMMGGPAGAGFPRVPPSITRPGSDQRTGPSSEALSMPELIPAAELPAYGLLDLPTSPDEDFQAGGMSLDEAIDRLVRDNLNLRALAFEIPQAQADILTASLRANPILYADVQMVPYGSFANDRNGGPTQYDVNVSIPLDLSGKRQARMTVAGHAKSAVEAQYQDAVRLTIDNLYTAFVDVLAARETVRFAEASVEGLDALLEPMRRRLEEKLIAEAEINRVIVQREFSGIAQHDASETYRKTQHVLGLLLNIPATDAERIVLSGTLRDTAPPPPPDEILISMALQCRPDLLAYRHGVARAGAEVSLAEANKWADLYWMVQPYSFQDLRPFGGPDPNAVSWATGLTVPLPLSNRNQGNIQRARTNVLQTRTELAALERSIAAEVIQAAKDYRVTSGAVRRVEVNVLPAARQILESARLNFERGETDVVAYLEARREFNEFVRRYRDLLVQHRRSMLRLNTVVARRVMP